MNYSIRGTTLTVHTDHEAGTVRVTRTADATTIADLTLAQAREASELPAPRTPRQGTPP